MMADAETFTVGAAEQPLAGYRWRSAQPKAVVLLIHGVAEHCRRYDNLGSALNTANMDLCAIDLPGHGHSHGARGHIDRFSSFADATLCLRGQLTDWYDDLPVYLYGHSMGGLVAASLLPAHQSRFAGCILSGSALMSPLEPGKIQLGVLAIISSLFPRLGFMQLDASGISRDPVRVRQYEDDPLVFRGKLSVRMACELMRAVREVKAAAHTISLPLLLMHGGADSITSPEGSRYIYEQSSSRDKQLKIHPDLYHEILHEPEGPDIIAEVISWIEARLALSDA